MKLILPILAVALAACDHTPNAHVLKEKDRFVRATNIDENSVKCVANGWSSITCSGTVNGIERQFICGMEACGWWSE